MKQLNLRLTLWLVCSGLALLLLEMGSTLLAAAAPTTATHLPRSLSPLTGVQQVATGTRHTCVVTTAGAVLCWGHNDFGQLGDGTRIQRDYAVAVTGLQSGVQQVVAGIEHTCALTDAGAVFCWGDNGFGELGDGTTEDRLTPVAVTSLGSGVTALTANGSHTCALTSAGALFCWGHNSNGQLGDGTLLSRTNPVAVQDLASGVKAVAAGGQHTCAIKSDEGIFCWGQNLFGQLGDNTTEGKRTPVQVENLGSDIAAITAGSWHSCAIQSDGALFCWGSNPFGQLGDGSNENQLTPVAVNGSNSGVQAVAGNGNHTCGLTTAGALFCWGNNSSGQLGDGADFSRNQSSPVAVVGLGNGVTSAAADASHSCAVTGSGGLLCWGSNHHGVLGVGDEVASSNIPLVVQVGLETITTPTPSPITTPTPLATIVIEPQHPVSFTHSADSSSLQVEIPTGAVSETTTLHYTRWATPTTVPTGLVYADYAFALTAFRDAIEQEMLTFQRPVTLTIDYNSAALTEEDELSLALYYYDLKQDAWSQAGITPVSREPARHRLTLHISHLSRFALFVPAPATVNQAIFLPLVVR